MKKRILKLFVTLFATTLLLISANAISVRAQSMADIGWGALIPFHRIINTYPQLTKSITQLKSYSIESLEGSGTMLQVNNPQTRTIEFKAGFADYGRIYPSDGYEILYYNSDNLVTSSKINNRDRLTEFEYEYHPNGVMSKITSNDGFYRKMDEHGNVVESNIDGYTYSSYTYGNNYILQNWIDASGNSGWNKQTDNGDGTFTHENSKGDYSVENYSNFAGYEQYDSYGRLVMKNTGYTSGKKIYYYDSYGRLIRADNLDGSHVVNFEYDSTVPVFNASLDISPKQGKSTVNDVQGTGDTFTFTAVTSPFVSGISLKADKFNGNEWHEITYEYLKNNYQLQSYITADGLKVWYCKFGINDAGNRVFRLMLDGADTGIEARVTVDANAGSFSPTPQQGNISVLVNGNPVSFDVQPQVINNRTMIPLRAVAEAIGAEVEWNQNLNRITIRGKVTWNDTTTILDMYLDKDIISWVRFNSDYTERISDGMSDKLDSPPVVIDGRTLVPIRAIAEIFGYKVEWDAATQTVTLNDI